MEESKYGVHRRHCCALHGCKYGNDDCPVTNRIIDQEYPCEECSDVEEYGILTTEHHKKLQSLTDAFNEKYYKAVETSDATAYFDACLIGRQLIFYLGKEGIVKDIKK